MPQNNDSLKSATSIPKMIFQIFAGCFEGKKGALNSVLRMSALSIIAAYLIYKLSAIGWGNVIHALPSSPIFYILSLAFVALPIIAERLVFPMAVTGIGPLPLEVFIRKHVINKAVMNYAGEGYFLQQISRLKGVNLQEAAVIVKNLALVRTFAANFWILLLVLCAVAMGKFTILQKIMLTSPSLVMAVGFICLSVCIASIVFFRKLTRLKFSTAKKIASIYVIRSFLAASILTFQWSIALPGTPLTVWVSFLVVFFLAKKSPIGGDLVFVSVALALPGLTVNEADVAATLLMMAATLQIIYFSGFLFTSGISNSKRCSDYSVTNTATLS